MYESCFYHVFSTLDRAKTHEENIELRSRARRFYECSVQKGYMGTWRCNPRITWIKFESLGFVVETIMSSRSVFGVQCAGDSCWAMHFYGRYHCRTHWLTPVPFDMLYIKVPQSLDWRGDVK